MILDRNTLDQIARGDVTLAFRKWRRPTVRTGGTLLTSVGQLEIGSVAVIETEAITAEDARLAGYPSKEALLAELNRREGVIYRIELGAIRPDPRIALRETPLDARQTEDLHQRLSRLDAASPEGPWTLKVLQVIRDHPGLRAADLCQLVSQERDRFKPNVRKLKKLGLTISLEVGYRLSPRGETYLRER
ncbi:MAG: hypothetical protein ACRENP_25040 [Longimicrobiales bacterium]